MNYHVIDITTNKKLVQYISTQSGYSFDARFSLCYINNKKDSLIEWQPIMGSVVTIFRKANKDCKQIAYHPILKVIVSTDIVKIDDFEIIDSLWNLYYQDGEESVFELLKGLLEINTKDTE